MSRLVLFLFLLPSLGLLSRAEAATGLMPPQQVLAAANQQLDRCTKAASTRPLEGNQLVTAGLAACYDGAQALLTAHIERAVQRIQRSQDAHCATLWAEFDDSWASHTSKVMSLPSLADAALNTNDDLNLLLSAHRYQVAYAIAGNYGCKLPAR